MPDGRAALEQVRGARVPQRVRRELQAGAGGVPFHDQAQAARRVAMAVTREEKRGVGIAGQLGTALS